MINMTITGAKRTANQGVFAVLGTAALLLVAACGGSGEESGPENSEVVIAQGVDPTTMDPLQQRETTTVNVLQHFYDPLLRRNAEDTQQFDPVLAESWEMVDDTTLRLSLRDDAVFADGEPFDAADVKYTVDYLLGELPEMDPALAQFQFEPLTGAEVVDEHTVEIMTAEPDPLLLDRLSSLFMVPEGAVDEDPEALAGEPNGTGPYRMVQWDRNSQVVMEARDDYFLGAPEITSVIFKTIADGASRLAGLQSGDIDIITNVPADNVAEVDAADGVSVKTVPSTRIASIWLNPLESELMEDARVRRALNHAVDVDTIIEQVMSGYGERVATIVPENFTNYDPDIQPLEFNPDLARQLLAEAGYADGFTMELLLPQGRYPFAEEVAQAIQSYLADVGVTAELRIVEFGVFAETTQQRTIEESFFGAWGNAVFNPIDELNVAVKSGDSGFSWYNNPEVDALIDEANVTIDAGRQQEIVSEIQAKMLEDPPFIFLFAYEDIYGVSDQLNWEPRSDEAISAYEASLKG